MQDLLKQIVEMDKKAREITDAAQREKIDSEKDVVRSREDIRKKYLEEARRRIAANEPKERAVAEAEWLKAKKRDEMLSQKLDRLYSENGDKWVEEITARVTGE
ncbi:MAG TPA: hypothetical protein DIV41_06495 [Ruminococcaceae bacterium]|nr:hypothetical protein [Oscillospiraceae bacterium]